MLVIPHLDSNIAQDIGRPFHFHSYHMVLPLSVCLTPPLQRLRRLPNIPLRRVPAHGKRSIIIRQRASAVSNASRTSISDLQPASSPPSEAVSTSCESLDASAIQSPTTSFPKLGSSPVAGDGGL